MNGSCVLMLAFFVGLFYVSTSAEARTVVRTGDAVSLAEEQSIEGDFYTAAGKINVSGTVSDDILAAGGQITINGSIGADAFLLAGSVDIHGPIGDDLRIISGEVTIAEPVAGDVFVIGGSVTILSTASVAGDVLVYGGQVIIEGPVEGDVLGRVDTLRIDAPVAGNVDISVAQLTLGDKASVGGSITYVSNTLLIQSLNASIGGDVVRNEPILLPKDMNVRSALIPVLVLLFSVLVWYLIAKDFLGRVVNRALSKSPRQFLLGLATLLFAPLAIAVLMVSVIGTIVGTISLLGYLLLVMLSVVGLSAVLGQLLMKVFNQPSVKLSLLTLVVGVVGVSLLLLLPVLGMFILSGFMILTLGSLVDLLIRPKVK